MSSIADTLALDSCIGVECVNRLAVHGTTNLWVLHPARRFWSKKGKKIIKCKNKYTIWTQIKYTNCKNSETGIRTSCKRAAGQSMG